MYLSLEALFLEKKLEDVVTIEDQIFHNHPKIEYLMDELVKETLQAIRCYD